MKFLFDSVVPQNLDSMLLKLCEFSKVFIFQGCTMICFYKLHYREKNAQQYVVLYTEMSFTLVL